AGQRPTTAATPPPNGLARMRAENDDHADLLEPRELAFEERLAAIALGRRRPIGGGHAPNRRTDVRPVEHQAIAGPHRDSSVREARAIQRAEEPVTRTVTGEHASGPVPSVPGGGEAPQPPPPPPTPPPP